MSFRLKINTQSVCRTYVYRLGCIKKKKKLTLSDFNCVAFSTRAVRSLTAEIVAYPKTLPVSAMGDSNILTNASRNLSTLSLRYVTITRTRERKTPVDSDTVMQRFVRKPVECTERERERERVENIFYESITSP